MLAYLTGHTCGDACWHAREEVCRCSCGGANHGILNKGGVRPERTSKKNGAMYILAGVAPTYHDAQVEARNIENDCFPGMDANAYGNWRDSQVVPVIVRKASDTQLKWTEVAACTGQNIHLIWRLPAGERYITKCSKDAFYSPTKQYIPPQFAVCI